MTDAMSGIGFGRMEERKAWQKNRPFTSVCLPLDKRPNYLAAHPVPLQVIYKDGLPQLRAASNPDSFNDGNGEIDPEEEPHWIIGPGQNYLEACEEALSHEDENLELVVQYLKDEVRRLQVFESECMFKDDLIDQLKDLVAYLQVKLRQFEVGSLEITGHDQLNCATGTKMLQLEMKTAATEQISSLIISPQEDPAVPSVASHDSSQTPLVEVGQQSSEGVVEPTTAPPTGSLVEEPKATPPSSSFVEEPKAVLQTSSAVAPEQDFEGLKKERNLARGLLCRMQENFASKSTVGHLEPSLDVPQPMDFISLQLDPDWHQGIMVPLAADKKGQGALPPAKRPRVAPEAVQGLQAGHGVIIPAENNPEEEEEDEEEDDKDDPGNQPPVLPVVQGRFKKILDDLVMYYTLMATSSELNPVFNFCPNPVLFCAASDVGMMVADYLKQHDVKVIDIDIDTSSGAYIWNMAQQAKSLAPRVLICRQVEKVVVEAVQSMVDSCRLLTGPASKVILVSSTADPASLPQNIRSLNSEIWIEDGDVV